MPSEEELAKWQRVIPVMKQALQGEGLVEVAEDKVFVTGLRGPLEEGWQDKVDGFVTRILTSVDGEDSVVTAGADVV